jgi:hypothetical protein
MFLVESSVAAALTFVEHRLHSRMMLHLRTPSQSRSMDLAHPFNRNPMTGRQSAAVTHFPR